MSDEKSGGRQISGPGKAAYRNPPAEHRFKKGQSGNPRGRPKQKKKILKALVDIELNRTLPIVQNGRRHRISCLEAIVKRCVQDALTGNPLERRLAMKFLTDNLPASTRESPPQSIEVKFRKTDEDI